ncbi:putative protein OCTOPUS [Helianthus annuus]|nr:putative protein OCTOPUS [Helianthus annuus]
MKIHIHPSSFLNTPPTNKLANSWREKIQVREKTEIRYNLQQKHSSTKINHTVNLKTTLNNTNMAFYTEEEEVYKCPKHPLKRRRTTGICPTCLRDRLVTLCPECANTRPCSCSRTREHEHSTSTSSSSSSSSFSLFQYSRGGSRHGNREVGRISNLIESEPAFRKSRSLAIPFLRSRSRYGLDQEFVEVENKKPAYVSRSKINFWSVFKVGKSSKCDLHDDGSNKSDGHGVTEDYSRMLRSRSVAVGAGDGFSPATTKRRGWYFPSPLKVFRQSKTTKLHMHERSPMHRG